MLLAAALLVLSHCDPVEAKPIDRLPAGGIRSVATGSDSLIAVGDNRGTVWVVDLDIGVIRRTVRDLNGSVSRLEFSPSGRSLAAFGFSRADTATSPSPTGTYQVQLLDPYSEATPILAEVEPDWLVDGATTRFDPSGDRMLVLEKAHSVVVLEVTTGKRVHTLVDPRADIACMDWWGSHRIVTGSSSGSLRVWNAADGKIVDTPIASGDPIDLVSVSPAQDRLVVGRGIAASMLRLPGLQDCGSFRVVSGVLGLGKRDRYATASWSRDGDQCFLTTATWFTVECRSSWGHLRWSHDYAYGDPATIDAAVDPQSRFASISTPGMGPRLLDLRTHAPVEFRPAPSSARTTIAWSRDGKSMVYFEPGGPDPEVHVVDVLGFTPRWSVLLDSSGSLLVRRPQ